MKRVAAIDFGSNAIRLVIADTLSSRRYKIVEKFRFPVRVGGEVFQTGEISSNKQDEILEVFRKFKSHINYYKVEAVEAVATSALRDSKNSAVLIKKIEDISGLKLKLITGIEEANLIFKIIAQELPVLAGNTLLVDIGGGSTELIFIKDGKIEKLESYNNGTLRPLKESEVLTLQMKDMIKNHFPRDQKVKVVGTGGNLRRLGKMRKKICQTENGVVIEKGEVAMIYNQLKNLTPPQIIKKYDLKPDRAEVIVPALKIFNGILEELNPEAIYLPKLGLTDSLLSNLATD